MAHLSGIFVFRGRVLVFLALTLSAFGQNTSLGELLPESIRFRGWVVERLVASGGDAESDGRNIILVSMGFAVEEDFKLVADLKGVKYFDCSGSKTDGRGLVNITQMKRLEKLWISDTKIQEMHLAYISNFPRLRVLFLDDTPLTDRGLQYLRDLKSLEELDLTNTNVTDAGLKHLRSLKNLKSLNLDRTKVTAKGVKELKKRLPAVKIWPSRLNGDQ
jgi:Leucine-rich repeat (LRR) protein